MPPLEEVLQTGKHARRSSESAATLVHLKPFFGTEQAKNAHMFTHQPQDVPQTKPTAEPNHFASFSVPQQASDFIQYFGAI